MVIGEGRKSKIKNQKAKLQIKIQKSVSHENSSTGSGQVRREKRTEVRRQESEVNYLPRIPAFAGTS